MELALMRHQIGSQLADRGAIHDQPEMLGSDVVAAGFQTFGHGRAEAGLMAAQTLFDAGAGCLGELVHRRLRRGKR